MKLTIDDIGSALFEEGTCAHCGADGSNIPEEYGSAMYCDADGYGTACILHAKEILRERAQAAYVERVAYYLKGCDGVSTGVCPGCEECRTARADYVPREDDEDRWTFRARSDETYPSEDAATDAAREAFSDDVRNEEVYSEGSFSWTPCDICGCTLGGTREDWHYVNPDTREIVHSDGACEDCVAYLANGTLPEGD